MLAIRAHRQCGLRNVLSAKDNYFFCVQPERSGVVISVLLQYTKAFGSVSLRVAVQQAAKSRADTKLQPQMVVAC
jgi:hypothetical protein